MAPTSPPGSTLVGPAVHPAPSAVRTGLPPVRGHLDQVDLFRTLTFASVVAVHAFAFTSAPDGPVAGGVAMLLHYTREAFFFLTGFVLVHAQRDRQLQSPQLLVPATAPGRGAVPRLVDAVLGLRPVAVPAVAGTGGE